MSKLCTKCGKEKPIEEFYRHRGHKDGLNSCCKICHGKDSRRRYRKNPKRYRRIQKKWQRDNKERFRLLNRKTHLKQYDITLDDYNRMFIGQNGCCAICGRHQSEFKKVLAVDHDHKTGKVRGLLCIECNNLLGQLEKIEKINFVADANAYREK